VLVVDDERDTVLTLLDILRSEGCEANGLYSGTGALAAIGEFHPDAVILDIAMPGMSGWDVALEICKALGRERPLLIAISGEYMKQADRGRAEQSGFDYYFYKPCDPKVLTTLLGKLRTLR
jgi:CheY-like chemotaxis protein